MTGILAIGRYTDTDRDALHVREADEAFALGGTTPGDSYLVIEKIIDAAKQAGANAVVNIVSNYKNVVYSDAQKYECHAGAIMAGVALKADLANVK